MQTDARLSGRLPAPLWCFVVFGITTFYMPLVYLVVVVLFFTGGYSGELSEWYLLLSLSALYLTPVLWLVYLGWIVFSKCLALREKMVWIFCVTVLNMLGMPIFYVFMLRRYLGLEHKTGKKDEIELDRFLLRHKVPRERLSPEQQSVLRFWCREQRLTRYHIVPLIILASFMLYMTIRIIPEKATELFAEFPYSCIMTTRETAANAELTADQDMQELRVQVILLSGAICGIFATMSLAMLAKAIALLWNDRQALTLINFLKATAADPPGNG